MELGKAQQGRDAGCQRIVYGIALFISEMKGSWERYKKRGQEWPKASVQRVTEQTNILQSGEDIAEKADEGAPQNHERCGDFSRK